ncbi:hypothetical protein [Micromonospora sp. NPDC047730]|uniref:hypothetical protein n=1 Tax=Micromonospora sp. NPDC047730 TaxID=3364253 RepID=UPI003715DA42
MRHNPSPLLILGTIVAATAAACWVARRESLRSRQAVQVPQDPLPPDTRSVYWQVYSDVLEDLGGVGGGGPMV